MKNNKKISSHSDDDYLEPTKSCTYCGNEITKSEYDANDGICNSCVNELSDEFTDDNNGCF